MTNEKLRKLLIKYKADNVLLDYYDNWFKIDVPYFIEKLASDNKHENYCHISFRIFRDVNNPDQIILFCNEQLPSEVLDDTK